MPDVAFTAPHFAVTEIAQNFLRQGVSAIDAMIAASAAISVAYPHMNSLGGDGFWLIHYPGQEPIAIDACGAAAGLADASWYMDRNYSSIPARGGAAALCMGGTLDGWRVARDTAEKQGSVLTPLEQLLDPAISLARQGITVTDSLQSASEKVQPELQGLDAYQTVFCPKGKTLVCGDTLTNPGLADFLSILAKEGTEDFYRGRLAKNLTDWLEFSGSPLRLADFYRYRAQPVKPLSVKVAGARLFNLPAPTQGVASLLLLAAYDRLVSKQAPVTELEQVHYLVEATKQAFLIRDIEVTDPSRLSSRWDKLLSDDQIARCVDAIDLQKAMPWPKTANPGDTVWMSALDAEGCMVSFIQSVYWEFGSGLVHPEYGLAWNNRGTSFSLDLASPNYLSPGLKPFHTLNPAFALFDDGRRLCYGTMGGEGQPQTQAAVFSRYAYQGLSLEESIARDRWLLGRTWGDQSQDLKMEADLFERVGQDLADMGHDIKSVPVTNELMGHAGALLMNPDGSAVAATDPRSDGRAIRDQI